MKHYASAICQLSQTAQVSTLSTNSFIPRFPVELLVIMLTFVGCMEIKNLLVAFPELRRYAVVITEEALASYPLRFFDIPGVKRLTADDMKFGGVGYGRFAVKLYEVTPGYDFSQLLGGGGKELMDPTSFVYQYGSMSEMFTMRTEHRDGLSMNGEKVFFECDMSIRSRLPAQASRCSSILNIFRTHPAPPPPLKSLELHRCDVAEGLDAPHLERLVINMTNTAFTVPEIRNFNIPNIVTWHVYFNDLPPLIHSITFGSRDQERSFGIHHLGGLDPYAPAKATKTMLDGKYSTRPILDFDINRFSSLTLCGVPNCFGFSTINVIRLQKLRNLCVMETVSYDTAHNLYGNPSLTHPTFSAPHLESYIYMTSLPLRTVVPLSCVRSLKVLKVVTTKRGLRLGSLSSALTKSAGLKELEIVCELPMNELGIMENHIVFDRDDVRWIMESLILSKLVIHGCLFGKYNRHMPGAVISRGGPHRQTDIPLSELRKPHMRIVSLKVVRFHDPSDPWFPNVPNCPLVIGLLRERNLRNVQHLSLQQELPNPNDVMHCGELLQTRFWSMIKLVVPNPFETSARSYYEQILADLDRQGDLMKTRVYLCRTYKIRN